VHDRAPPKVRVQRPMFLAPWGHRVPNRRAARGLLTVSTGVTAGWGMSILLVPLANHGPEAVPGPQTGQGEGRASRGGPTPRVHEEPFEGGPHQDPWAMLDSVPSKFDEVGQYAPDWDAVGRYLQRILFKKWGRTTGLTHFGGIEPRADVTGYLINDATDEHRLAVRRGLTAIDHWTTWRNGDSPSIRSATCNDRVVARG
jgi:hypothetical protein